MSWVKEKKSLASLWSATAEKLEKLMTSYNVRDYKYIRNILKRIILPEHFKPKLLWGVLCWIAISHYLRIILENWTLVIVVLRTAAEHLYSHLIKERYLNSHADYTMLCE